MDLIIGGATNYSWNDLQYWINSIKKTGFKGDVVLVGTNMKKETIDKLTSVGVKLSLYGNKNEAGDVEAKSGLPPHVERFFYIWDYLEKSETSYNHVIVTDTRDVIFQTNPSEWLEQNLTMHELVASSEGMRYKNEPWGNSNLFQSFGGYFHNKLKDNYIYNVGVIAGTMMHVKSMMLTIFQMSLGRPIQIVDQAVYNFILNIPTIRKDVYFSECSNDWAVNLGTALDAVKAGSGDLGKYACEDQVAMKEYVMNFEDVQPKVQDDGFVVNPDGKKYSVVHQWDRVPSLKSKVESMYGDSNTIVYVTN
jgi:hypothetical protein